MPSTAKTLAYKKGREVLLFLLKIFPILKNHKVKFLNNIFELLKAKNLDSIMNGLVFSESLSL